MSRSVSPASRRCGDTVHVRVLSLVAPSAPGSLQRLRVSYMRRSLLECCARAAGGGPAAATAARCEGLDARGQYHFDAADAEAVCAMVDEPMIVTMVPLDGSRMNSAGSLSVATSAEMTAQARPSSETLEEVSCCNVDMLPVLCGHKRVVVVKRLELAVEPGVLARASWANLPVLTLELRAVRAAGGRGAGLAVELAALAACNLPLDAAAGATCALASHLPVMRLKVDETVVFERGRYELQPCLGGNIAWESIYTGSKRMAKSDKNIELDLNEIKNKTKFDAEKYLKASDPGTVVWGTFRRSLVWAGGGAGGWLADRWRDFRWPVELRAHAELSDLHTMAFLDLSSLLYPGETRVCTAVQLWWYNADIMLEQTGRQRHLAMVEPSLTKTRSVTRRRSKQSLTSEAGSDLVALCGADGEPAFVLLDFSLSRPLLEATIPPQITDAQMSRLLRGTEGEEVRRACAGRGRGHLWADCARRAEFVLSRVNTSGEPMDACSLARQMSTSRARVLLHTSLLDEAALYINDRFNLSLYLDNEEDYQTLLLMAHACLVRETHEALDTSGRPTISRELAARRAMRRAARHARQTRDYTQAERLLMEYLVERCDDGSAWRELGTCLMESAAGRAAVCLRQALRLNPRDPLTLLSLANVVMQESGEEAEAFFSTLVCLHPTWLPAWVAAHCYFLRMEQFRVADALLEVVYEISALPREQWELYQREWEHELGDWWERSVNQCHSFYLDTADLLLRLRAHDLAELCLARELIVTGESAPYLHLVALGYFLRGDVSNALCHVQDALTRFGDLGKNGYLHALGAACLVQLGSADGARAAAADALAAGGDATDTVLRAAALQRNCTRARDMLQGLLSERPCAQAWLALAYTWFVLEDYTEAERCCVEALGIDRRAARGWALLAHLLARAGRPARADFCRQMSAYCGHVCSESRELLGPTSPLDELLSENLTDCAGACGLAHADEQLDSDYGFYFV